MENQKKLRVLCLHGFNNTSEIFKFQLENYISSYGKYIDFVFLDGPFACPKLPLKPLMKMGFDGCRVIKNDNKPSSDPEKKPFPPSPGSEYEVEVAKDDHRYFCWIDTSQHIIKIDKKENGENIIKYGKTRLDTTVYGSEESITYIIDFINK